ncbi:MAG: hypothetical protein ACOWWR_10990 [Eubacteriales bacterium]
MKKKTKTRKLDTSPYKNRYDRLDMQLVEFCENYLKTYDPETEQFILPENMIETHKHFLSIIEYSYAKETKLINLKNIKIEKDDCYVIDKSLDDIEKEKIYKQLDDIFSQKVSMNRLNGNLIYAWMSNYKLYNPIFDSRTENMKKTPWAYTTISANKKLAGIQIPVQLYEDVICSKGTPNYWFMGLARISHKPARTLH